MSGSLAIAGLGPGDPRFWTSEVAAALEHATDVVGYIPYVARVPDRPGLLKHASDNRVELERARHAIELAIAGRQVVVVSSGDPGVFAMASAVFEAVEAGPDAFRQLEINVLPGITAMLAASARAGAILGHDFCAINLSDNLKPWHVIEKRLRLAIEADFACAFYNPRSKARPDGFGMALALMRAACTPERLITFARAVATPEEQITTVRLGDAVPEMADMRTVVLLGSSLTRQIDRPDRAPIVYTPRSVPE
ncbi:MAG: precorrin-3B C(17)-methyltransferase [Pseudomonadota bacterium]